MKRSRRSMAPNTGQYAVIDPRLGGDIVFERSTVPTRFSSRDEGYLVVECRRIEWLSLALILDDLLQADGHQAFVLFRPWFPRRDNKVEAFRGVFGPPHDERLEPLAFGVGNQPIAGQALVLFDRLGPGAGVMIVGAATSQDGLVSKLHEANPFADPPLFIMLDCVPEVRIALALDEGAMSTLLVAPTDASTPRFDSLLTHLGAQATRVDPEAFY